jgi:hypothetical protein
MATTSTKLNFLPIDEDSLSKANKAQLVTMRKAKEAYNNAKAVFEGNFITDNEDKIPTNHTLAFGYNFGRIAVAIVEAKTGYKAPKKVATYF